ncbi:MAG: NusG domain II-containing protein [Pseudomonadota bacterium]
MTHHIKHGDWLVMMLGIAAVAWLFAVLWQGGATDKVIIRSGGRIVVEASLALNQTFAVAGPLGTTLVTVQNRRARVAADPSPRQYCVMEGWLARAGEAAVCLPNQVSVELAGPEKSYDSLSY